MWFIPSAQKTKENLESDWTLSSLSSDRLRVAATTGKVKRVLLPDPSRLLSAVDTAVGDVGGNEQALLCHPSTAMAAVVGDVTGISLYGSGHPNSPPWGVSFAASFVTITIVLFSFFGAEVLFLSSWLSEKIHKLINAMMLYVFLAIKGVFGYML